MTGKGDVASRRRLPKSGRGEVSLSPVETAGGDVSTRVLSQSLPPFSEFPVFFIEDNSKCLKLIPPA